jgi:hypothetical protein
VLGLRAAPAGAAETLEEFERRITAELHARNRRPRRCSSRPTRRAAGEPPAGRLPLTNEVAELAGLGARSRRGRARVVGGQPGIPRPGHRRRRAPPERHVHAAHALPGGAGRRRYRLVSPWRPRSRACRPRHGGDALRAGSCSRAARAGWTRPAARWRRRVDAV